MGIMLPVASGKGGVGKSVFSVNLGVALAELGKTVVLADLDLGASNLHTLLGIKNRHNGFGGLIHKTDPNVEALVIESGIPRLFFIPGDGLLPGTANLDYFVKRKILKELAILPADYVIMDLGAGSSYNVVDFFLSSSSGIIATMPEITSVLNSYSFLKTALYRALFRSFPPKGQERKMISEFVSRKIEGTDESFSSLLDSLSSACPATAPDVIARLSGFYPRVVINMGKSNTDLAIGGRLRDIAQRNLGLTIEYIGFAPWDNLVPRSVAERRPILLGYPQAPYSATLRAIARRIMATPLPPAPRLYQDNEDLVAVAEEGLAHGQQAFAETSFSAADA